MHSKHDEIASDWKEKVNVYEVESGIVNNECYGFDNNVHQGVSAAHLEVKDRMILRSYYTI